MLLELLTIYGISFALQHANLLNKPRNWICNKSNFIDELLSCAFCTGAWSGLLGYMLLNIPAGTFQWYMLFAYFFAGAAFCYIMDLISDYFEITNQKNSDAL